MLLDLQAIAPHMLGVFMIALACVPLVFVWQDRGRRTMERNRITRLQREARVAARLRARGMPAGALPLAESPLGGSMR